MQMRSSPDRREAAPDEELQVRILRALFTQVVQFPNGVPYWTLWGLCCHQHPPDLQSFDAHLSILTSQGIIAVEDSNGTLFYRLPQH